MCVRVGALTSRELHEHTRRFIGGCIRVCRRKAQRISGKYLGSKNLFILALLGLFRRATQAGFRSLDILVEEGGRFGVVNMQSMIVIT
jgi:hypothetical protein